jgi:hypothetical protein
LDVCCILPFATGTQVARTKPENLTYNVGALYVGRNHYVPCNELKNVPVVVGCSMASLVVSAVPVASWLVRMIEGSRCFGLYMLQWHLALHRLHRHLRFAVLKVQAIVALD